MVVRRSSVAAKGLKQKKFSLNEPAKLLLNIQRKSAIHQIYWYMMEDDVDAIMTKTREYYNFINRMIERESIVLKQDDLEVLVNIGSYFAIHANHTRNSTIAKNILSTCISFLQRLDRITKEYKIFQNGA